MTDGAAALLPIVIDYAHLECGGWCFYGCSDLLDTTSGKTRHHLQLVLDEAIKTGFDDLVILTPNALPRVRAYADKLCKRKRSLQQLRITMVDIPLQFGKTQADRLRLLYERQASLISKGFIYINGHCLPTTDLKSLVIDFRKNSKKLSSLSIRIIATKADINTDLDQHIVAYDKRNNLLLGLCVFDRLRAQTFNISEFCEENKRVLELTENNGEITSDLQLSFDHFICNSKVMEGLLSNIDFQSVQAYVMDSLAKPVDLDGCQLLIADKATTTRNTSVRNFRQLRQLLKSDSGASSDAIELEGNKSYWKVSGDINVVHENVELPEGILLDNVIIMKDVKLSPEVTCIKDSVIGAGAVLKANCSSSYICPDVTVHQEVLSSLIVPDALLQLMLPLDPSLFVEEQGFGESDHQIKCTPFWIDRNITVSPTLNVLENDPTSNKEGFFDDLFDLNEKQDERVPAPIVSQELDEEFRDDVIDLVSSGEVGHMQDLVLELRTLRLSENKKDSDLMRAFGAHVCELAQSTCGFKTSDQISEMLAEKDVYSIIDAFCSDEESRFGFYRGVIDYLSKLPPSDQNQAAIFVAVISSLNEVLLNENHLPAFLEQSSSVPASISNSPLIRQYLEWLREDDDDDDDDDDDSDAEESG